MPQLELAAQQLGHVRQLHGWHDGHVVLPPERREAAQLSRVSLRRRARHRRAELPRSERLLDRQPHDRRGLLAGVFHELHLHQPATATLWTDCPAWGDDVIAL